jgi:hypothetical protein
MSKTCAQETRMHNEIKKIYAIERDTEEKKEKEE